MTALTDTGRGRITLPIKDLAIHSANPRTDVGDIQDLAASIKEHGVLAPLVVAKENGHIGVVDGSRRLAAAKLAGLTEVPITFLTDDDAQVAALVLNLKRLDLNPLEEAEGYRKWLDLTGKSQRDLAAAVGKDESTISNALRLLKAPAPLKSALREESVGGAHARELMRLEDESLFSKVKLKKGTTVREVQDQVTSLNRDWQNKGPGAVAEAKKFLEAARAKYPNATITWKHEPSGPVLDLADAFGKAPAHIVGRIHNAKTHDKACACRAYEMDTVGRYIDFDPETNDDIYELAGFELVRACIDRAGHEKYQAADRRSIYGSDGSSAVRKKSPAQLAKEREKRQREFRTTVNRILAGGGHYGDTRFAPADVEKVLVGSGYTSEKATRVVFLSYILERVGGSAELLEVVRRVLKMKDADLRKMVLRLAAREVNDRLVGEGKTSSPFDGQLARYEFLKAYGQKVTEPKRKDRAKKKAKR